MTLGIGKTIIIVLDGFGVGEQPDAYLFESRRANTLSHLSEVKDKLRIPNLVHLGLSNLTYIKHWPRDEETTGFFGKAAQKNEANDSIGGHREILGVYSEKKLNNFSTGIDPETMQVLTQITGKRFLGNSNDHQQDFLAKYGEAHLKNGDPIILVTDDSLVHIYVHEEKFQPDEFYMLGHSVWEVLSEHGLGRLHVHYFTGDLNAFTTETNMPVAMFNVPPRNSTLVSNLYDNGIPVFAIGKVSEMLEGNSVKESWSVKNNNEALEKLNLLIREGATNRQEQALIVANLPDFDLLHGHNRDPHGYIKALENFDQYLPRIFRSMKNEDILYITSDHGNDPTAEGTLHTREYVPLLVHSRMFRPRRKANLGIRTSLADIAETIAESYDINVHFAANSFWGEMISQL